MVNVEIDDGDAFGTVLLARIKPGDGGVGEQAEAHGAIGLGMMAGRSHLAEGVGSLTVDDRVDCGEAGADRTQGRLPRAGGDDGVAVDVARMLERALGDGAHFGEVRLGMRQQDLLLDIVAQRRLVAHEILEDVVRQHLVDGAHAVRPLGMAGAGVVRRRKRDA